MVRPPNRKGETLCLPANIWQRTTAEDAFSLQGWRKLPPLRDAKFGSTALSWLHDDLYIVPEGDEEPH